MSRQNDSSQHPLPLRIASAWLQALTDGSREVVALVGEDGSIHYLSVSGAVEDMLGYETLELLDMSPNEVLHPLDTRRVLEAFWDVASHPGARITSEYRARHRVGHYVHLQSTAVNRLNNEHINAVVIHTRLVPGSAQRGGEPVARLCDEQTFMRAVAEAVSRESYHYTVLVLEVTRYDDLVEIYGEQITEQLIEEMGRRLAASLRPDDTVTWRGNGRFAVLLDSVGDRSRAEQIAARVLHGVGTSFHVESRDIHAPVHIGIATSERRYDRAADILRDAGIAARSAFERGDERRAVFRTQMHVEHSRHLGMLGELNRAVQNQEFKLHYLPIVSLATRTLSGLEALLRWHHPDRGIVTPDQFLPLAEETGLIVQLGRWVIDEACRQLIDWRERYPLDPPLYVTINLSTRQFADFDLHEQIRQVMDETGLRPRELTVELTEAAMLEHRDAVRDAAQRLKRLGVKLSLDNFGVGASSFTSLQEFAFDTLKIDRSLVGAMSHGSRNRDIVRAVIDMAHDLGMEVVAEGVETASQAAQLAKMWCEHAQGHLFSRDKDSDGIEGLLASYPRWWE